MRVSGFLCFPTADPFPCDPCQFIQGILVATTVTRITLQSQEHILCCISTDLYHMHLNMPHCPGEKEKPVEAASAQLAEAEQSSSGLTGQC